MVKVDFTIKEEIVFPLESRQVVRAYEQYHDLPEGAEILAYSCLKPGADGAAPAEVFYRQLQQQAYAALDHRGEAFEQLQTPEQIAQHQQRLREFFTRQLGGFPELAPLNAQVVGTLPGEGYRIEKVIFESQPQHHVTANLYLPEGPGPFPGVLVSSGHSRTGKTADYNQRFGIAMAQHGMAALCYDPIGQGERSQILSDDGQPQFPGTTTEHFLIGVGSILVGTNTAAYRVWDAMRAIDYLASRPDIDADRIGFTGCSGGDTLTSYVMAREQQLAAGRRAFWESASPDDARRRIREMPCIRPVADMPAATREKAGRVDRDGYHIDKLVLHTDRGVPLPALTFHPVTPREDAYLYLHEGGKLADAAPGGPIEKLVHEGYVVVAVDLSGQGETADAQPDTLLGDWKSFYLAYLLGKSRVGIQAEDMLSAARFIAEYQTETPRQVHVVGVGSSGIAALHAAALEPELFTTLTLRGTPADWSTIVGQSIPAGQLTSTVHGALAVYDLPDLASLAGADRVRVKGAE